jgi:carbonic anhydrase
MLDFVRLEALLTSWKRRTSMARIGIGNGTARWVASAGVITAAAWLATALETRGAPPTATAAEVAATPAEASAEALSADAAFDRLVAGNRRFVAGKSEHPSDSVARREELKSDQHPFAIVLACADSRVAPELVFDQGLGDLFVVRVAGNVTDPAVTGSISYAVHHLHAPLLVVLGHQGCGAVKAALMEPAELAKEPEEIQALVHYVQPALKDLAPSLSGNDRLRAAIAANVRRSVSQLEQASAIKEAVAEQHLKIVGGVYSLDTGKVELLR